MERYCAQCKVSIFFNLTSFIRVRAHLGSFYKFGCALHSGYRRYVSCYRCHMYVLLVDMLLQPDEDVVTAADV